MHKHKLLKIAPFLIVILMLVVMSGKPVNATRPQKLSATLGATSPAIQDISTATPTTKGRANTGMITGQATGEAEALAGAGSTFAVPLYSKWFSDYAALTGVKIDYQGIGSSEGIKGIQTKTLDFGATDGFMTDEQNRAAQGGNILHIATALGGVSIVYNIPELSEPIKLTGDTLSLMYLGASAANSKDANGKPLVPLLTWNDPRLVADNPGLKNVAKNIWVIHRADGSGTTNIFTSYLSTVNANWQKDIGAGNTVAWPGGGLEGIGSKGVQDNLTQVPYTIGYVEQAYADQNGLQVALLKNKAGKWVKSTAETVAEAGAGARLPADLRTKIVNVDRPGAYPIVGFTWILVYERQTDPAKALALVRALWWGIHDGQASTAALGYAPLPAVAVTLDETQLAKITINNKPALPPDLLAAVTPLGASNTGMIMSGVSGEAQSLNGAGSTFAVPLYSQWFSTYAALTNVKIDYKGIGSSGGIKGIQDQSLDFGATDGFMTDEQIRAAKGGNVLHVATALGGVTIVYNIPELSDPIKLTSETLPLIYLGSSAAKSKGPDGKPLVPLLKWNDPRLVADNPGLKDIAKNILVIHRSDGSGTTNILTSYLSAIDPNWQKDVGSGNTVAWPVGVAAQGSKGVQDNLAQAPYTIGYVEQAYADQNGLQVASLKNKAGNWVTANTGTVAAAAAGMRLPGDLRTKIVNADGPNAYPIAGFTWILVYERQTDPEKALALVRALWWGVHDGQADTANLGYAPLPVSAIALDEAQLAKITVNNKVVMPPELLAAIKTPTFGQ